MSNNDSQLQDIVNNNQPEYRDVLWAIIVQCCILALSLCAIIYGVTSWCLLKQFRNFKNYMYLNTIAANLIRLISLIVYDYERNTYPQIFYSRSMWFFALYFNFVLYLTAVQCCWLLLICYMSYVDIVQVFKAQIKKKYFKSALFAWCAPLIYMVCVYATGVQLVMRNVLRPTVLKIVVVCLYLPFFIINVCFYGKVVYTLFRSNGSAGTATNKWRRFYIATLIFVLTDFVMVFTMIDMSITKVLAIIEPVTVNIGVVAIDLFLMFCKRNRVIWHEYNVKRLNNGV